MVQNDLDDLDGLHGGLHSWLLPLRSFHQVAAILIGRQDSLDKTSVVPIFWYGSCATLKV
jgi:hypothetical protein